MTTEEFNMIYQKLGLSDRTLAHHLGMATNTVYKMRKGQRPVMKQTELLLDVLLRAKDETHQTSQHKEASRS